MKHLFATSALALAMIGLSGTASAQDDTDIVMEDEIVAPRKAKDLWFHADASLGLMQFSVTEGNTEYVSDLMGAGFVRAGVKYKYIGAEVELGSGFSDYEEDGITLGVSNQVAAFGILRLPQDRSDLYLRLGYHESDVDVGIDGRSFSTTDGGLAGGIGGTYFFAQNIGARFDITSYNLSDPLDVAYVGGTLGLAARF